MRVLRPSIYFMSWPTYGIYFQRHNHYNHDHYQSLLMIATYLRLSVIVLIILGSAAGAAPVEVSVTSDVDSIEIGQPLSINISIDPVGNPITGAQFNILFNGSVIEIENITEGVLFKQNGSNTAFSSGVLNNTEGTLINVWGLIITPGANVTAKSTFATIKINAKNTGSSILNLSRVIVSDPDSKAVPVNITNVSIITNAASQPPGGNNVGGGSSGGGGGGGGTSGENFTNIEIKEKYDRFINKDVTTSYVFKETDPILSVNITANISAGDINVAVEVLRNISSLVKSPPPDTVYKNVNIWVGTYGFATPKNIKHADITFRVPVSWIKSNSIDPDSITMMHYQGEWAPLPTKKTSETSEWIYYEASTTRFSPHAITGKKSYSASYEGIPQMTTTPETQQRAEKQISTDGNEEESPEYISRYLIIGVIIGIVINATLIFMNRKPKEKGIFNYN